MELQVEREQSSAELRSIYRDLALKIYLPAGLLALSQSAVIPVLPILAAEAGSAAEAGALVSMKGLGALCVGALVGVAVARIGERAGMLSGAAVITAASLGCAAAYHLWELFAFRLLTGVGFSFFQISRLSYIAANVPNARRGRVNSLIGGTGRLANMVGPLAGGALLEAAGASAPFLLQAALQAAAFACVMLAMPKPPTADASPLPPADDADADADGGKRAAAEAGEPAGCVALLRRLAPVGAIGFAFATVRSSRSLLLPLRAHALGLTKTQVGAATALSYVLDAATFPAGGYLSDKVGRKWAAVPSLVGMGAGLALLGCGGGVTTLLVAAGTFGMGNGLSAGLVMTIGQDAAPRGAGRARFVGLYKNVVDSGQFAGPALVGLVARLASLEYAAPPRAPSPSAARCSSPSAASSRSGGSGCRGRRRRTTTPSRR